MFSHMYAHKEKRTRSCETNNSIEITSIFNVIDGCIEWDSIIDDDSINQNEDTTTSLTFFKRSASVRYLLS